jgi:hypothetical protein
MTSLGLGHATRVNSSVVPPWPLGRRVKVIRVSIQGSGPSVTRHATWSGVSVRTCMTAAGFSASPK